MTLPKLTADFFEPFLGRVNRLALLLEETIPKLTEPRQRELLESLREEIRFRREEFVSIAIPEVLETHRQIGEKSLELEATLAGASELRTKADELRRLIEENARAMAAAAAKPPSQPPAPAPQAGIPLLDGDTLRDMLMGGRKAAHEPPGGLPRTTGNIWENWEPGKGLS